MSHELRTPLGSIIGLANLLATNKGKNLQLQELLYLERIRANGLHLLGLINDILDLSK
jgi:signal transduction histidine kinase